MRPFNYFRLWVRNFRRRVRRRFLRNEILRLLKLIYKRKIKKFNFFSYLSEKIYPNQIDNWNLNYIYIIILKFITLYIFFLILKDLWKFIKHTLWLFTKFIYKQRLVYWHFCLTDFENISYKFKLPRGYAKDAIKKFKILEKHLYKIDIYLDEYYFYLDSLVERNSEFYDLRKGKWQSIKFNVKNDFKIWKDDAIFYLFLLNYNFWFNRWVLRRYTFKIQKFKFNIFKPFRKFWYYKYKKIILYFIKVRKFLLKKYFYILFIFKKGAWYKNNFYKWHLIQKIKKNNYYLRNKYGLQRYNDFIIDYVNKVEVLDQKIVEDEIITEDFFYGRVLNEKHYYENLKGSNIIFVSIKYYLFQLSHKVYFDRNHYIMYLAELEAILKKRHFPEENFKTRKLWFFFHTKFWLFNFIRIYPNIAWLAAYIVMFLRIFWFFFYAYIIPFFFLYWRIFIFLTSILYFPIFLIKSNAFSVIRINKNLWIQLKIWWRIYKGK